MSLQGRGPQVRPGDSLSLALQELAVTGIPLGRETLLDFY